MDGYMKDAKGRLVPDDQVKMIDRARDDFVIETLKAWKKLQGEIKDFKEQLMGDFNAFVEMSAEQYGVKLGGVKGNVQLVSFDGSMKLTLAVSDSLSFDEQIKAAEALIHECAAEWTEGSRSEVKAIVNDAFQVDKKGNLSVTRILALRRLDINHPKWLKAMDAISNSVMSVGSKEYVRAYERDEHDKWVGLPLDIAAL